MHDISVFFLEHLSPVFPMYIVILAPCECDLSANCVQFGLKSELEHEVMRPILGSTYNWNSDILNGLDATLRT